MPEIARYHLAADASFFFDKKEKLRFFEYWCPTISPTAMFTIVPETAISRQREDIVHS